MIKINKTTLYTLLLLIPLIWVVADTVQAEDAEVRITIKDEEYGKHRVDFKIEDNKAVFLTERGKKVVDKEKQKKKNKKVLKFIYKKQVKTLRKNTFLVKHGKILLQA